MTQIIRNFGHWIPMYAVACLVIAASMLAVHLLRHRGTQPKWLRLLMTWLVLCWGLGVAFVTLFPDALGQPYDATSGLPARNLDLVPFAFSAGDGPSAIEVAANTVMFFVGGLLIAAKWRLNAFRTMVAGICIGLTVEALQFAFGIGRVSSVDDVLWAGLGALGGGACVSMVRGRRLTRQQQVFVVSP